MLRRKIRGSGNTALRVLKENPENLRAPEKRGFSQGTRKKKKHSLEGGGTYCIKEKALRKYSRMRVATNWAKARNCALGKP